MTGLQLHGEDDIAALLRASSTQLYFHISGTVAVSILGCPFLSLPATVYK